MEGGHNFHPSHRHQSKTDPHLPTMVVFDLDDCLWTPEMHELGGLPSVPVRGALDPDGDASDGTPQGAVGLSVPEHRGSGRYGRLCGGGDTVRLYDGARRVLRRLALDPRYRGIVIAAASSSLEPSYSHACLRGLDVLPGLTLRDMLSYDQIGREGKLSSRKTTHFRELERESGVPFEEMLFFDDCNWGDHVGDLKAAYGVIGQRTPNGLTVQDFEEGLKKYRKASERRAGPD